MHRFRSAFGVVLLALTAPASAQVPTWQVLARVEKQPLAAGECTWVSLDVRLPSGKLIPLPDGSGYVGAPQFELSLAGAAATQFNWARNTPGSYNVCATTTDAVDGQILVRYPRKDVDPGQLRPNVAFEGLLRIRAGGEGDGVTPPYDTLLLVPVGTASDLATTSTAGTAAASAPTRQAATPTGTTGLRPTIAPCAPGVTPPAAPGGPAFSRLQPPSWASAPNFVGEFDVWYNCIVPSPASTAALQAYLTMAQNGKFWGAHVDEAIERLRVLGENNPAYRGGPNSVRGRFPKAARDYWCDVVMPTSRVRDSLFALGFADSVAIGDIAAAPLQVAAPAHTGCEWTLKFRIGDGPSVGYSTMTVQLWGYRQRRMDQMRYASTTEAVLRQVLAWSPDCTSRTVLAGVGLEAYECSNADALTLHARTTTHLVSLRVQRFGDFVAMSAEGRVAVLQGLLDQIKQIPVQRQ